MGIKWWEIIAVNLCIEKTTSLEWAREASKYAVFLIFKIALKIKEKSLEALNKSHLRHSGDSGLSCGFYENRAIKIMRLTTISITFVKLLNLFFR